MNAHKSIGRGFVLALGGAVVGLCLRLVLMTAFYDYNTGFYTSQAFAWASLLLPLVFAAFAWGLFCGKDRRYGGYVQKQSFAAGALGIFSGLLLLYTGAALVKDYIAFLDTGISQYDSVQQGIIHIFFMVMCLVFGVVQILTGGGLLAGKDLFAKAPLLYVGGVLWGISNLIMIYVFYAKSPALIENFFSVIGAAALLFALLYASKLLARVDEPGSVKRLLVSVGLTAVLELSYLTGNLALFFTGRTYFGEMPVEYQAVGFSTALFLLALGLSLYRSSGAAWETEPTEAERRALREADEAKMKQAKKGER